MIIHVVKPGDSLYSISRLYNVSYNKIAADNELGDPNRLVVGQTLVILEGVRRHTVTSGQSFYSIAAFSVGSGTGPATLAPVDLAVSTIFSAD